jgi:hypothetical protein
VILPCLRATIALEDAITLSGFWIDKAGGKPRLFTTTAPGFEIFQRGRIL